MSISLGTIDGRAYKCELVICTHPEVIFGGADDPSGAGWKAEAAKGVNDAIGEVERVLGPRAAGEVERNGNWHDWQGGKYGSQAHKHGYRAIGAGILACVASCGLDDDGEPDEDWTWLAWADVPEQLRAELEEAGDAADDAMEAAVREALEAA